MGLRAARFTVVALMAAACLTPAAVAGAQPSTFADQSPAAQSLGPAAQAAADVSVGYQVNALHDGNLDSGVEVPPLTKAWTRDLGASVSYPVIADGRVFVTTPTGGGYGTSVYALDAVTGDDVWGPVDLGGLYFWSGLTYGQGKVFVLTYSGILQALDARTGAIEWAVALPGQYAFSSAPTYRAGLVFAGGAGTGGTVYGVSALDGRVLWTQPVANGDNSSPAVSDTGVYVSYACTQAYGFAPATGAPLWHYAGPCSGGGGKTTVLSNNRLWTRDSSGGTVFNASTGALLASFGAGPAPAFDGQVGFFLSGGVLKARNAVSQALLWSFAGDGLLSTAPIVVNGYVYVGSTAGHLWALDETTGLPVWDDNVGAPITYPDEHNVSQPLTGLGAGQGLIVVPASNLLVAYTGASGPTPPAIPAPARGWGLNAVGEVGDGTLVDRHGSVTLGGLPAPADVNGALLHSLSVQGDGTVKAWGWNAYGQVGDGTTADRAAPVTVSGLTDVVEVAGGALHSLALRDDGTVWAWGWNGYGQLGDGTTTSRRTPGPVPGLTGVVAIAAGFHHNLALRSDGTVWAWGFNGVGQVGDGSIVDRRTPVKVTGLSAVDSIAAGATHSVAVVADGTVRTWGWNIAGQLGDGTLTERHVPGPVVGLNHVYRVSAGFHHNVALREDGTIWSWGWNIYGQLGDGTTVTRALPVKVATSAVVVDVAAGGIHSVGLDENGAVGAWGWNDFGQVGDGTTTDRLVPVPVPGLDAASAVAAGGYHTLIL